VGKEGWTALFSCACYAVLCCSLLGCGLPIEPDVASATLAAVVEQQAWGRAVQLVRAMLVSHSRQAVRVHTCVRAPWGALRCEHAKVRSQAVLDSVPVQKHASVGGLPCGNEWLCFDSGASHHLPGGVVSKKAHKGPKLLAFSEGARNRSCGSCLA